MILFGLRDVGSGNACLPTIGILKDRGTPISIYAEGPAYKHFKDKFLFVTGYKMGDLLDFLRPSLVVATTAQIGGAVPIDLINKAKQRNLPVVLVEDIWASHSVCSWDVLPDGVCVVDEFAKKLILRSWPGYPESRIYITGMPVFDKFVNIQTKSAKHKLREVLGLCEDWPVVFFPGVGQVWGMTQAISMLIEALNNFDVPMYLIVRDHPKFTLSDASNEYRQIFSEYQEILKNLRIGRVVDSSKLTSNEVCAGSDIVVGTNSTMMVEACYIRKPMLTIWTPEMSKAFLEATNNTLAEWPITNLGVSLRAENVQEIENCLRKIIAGDTVAMLQAQQKHFQADGLSSNRVAKAILGYYR